MQKILHWNNRDIALLTVLTEITKYNGEIIQVIGMSYREGTLEQAIIIYK